MSMLRAIILTSIRILGARREAKLCQERADGHLLLMLTDGMKTASEIRRANQPKSDHEAENVKRRCSDKWNLGNVNKLVGETVAKTGNLKCSHYLCERGCV